MLMPAERRVNSTSILLNLKVALIVSQLIFEPLNLAMLTRDGYRIVVIRDQQVLSVDVDVRQSEVLLCLEEKPCISQSCRVSLSTW
jgi:hypothetical protein